MELVHKKCIVFYYLFHGLGIICIRHSFHSFIVAAQSLYVCEIHLLD